MPVIKMHEGGRHTYVSLSNEAGVDQGITQRQAGHSGSAMTDHYTHHQAEQNRAAAESVAALVDGSES